MSSNKKESLHTEYMKKLHSWQKICNYHYSVCWSYYSVQLMQMQKATNPPQSNAESRVSHNDTRSQQTAQTERRQEPTQIAEWEIAPVYLRFLAEIIDFFILMSVKVIFIYIAVTLFDISFTNVAFVNIQMILDDDITEETITADDLQNMILIGLMYRLLACLYEASFLSTRGATPGKELLHLKVIECRACSPSRRGNVSVFPGSTPGFGSAWLRSLVKNFAIAFLMPVFITVFFYQHNRASYDIISNTIVVKK